MKGCKQSVTGLTLLIILSFLSGCAVMTKPDTDVLVAPAWFTSPPEDNAEFLYGVAEKRRLDIATEAALATIATRLEVSLWPKLNLSVSGSDRLQATYSFMDLIGQNTGILDASVYKVLHTDHDADTQTYWVLVRIDRVALANAIQERSNRLKFAIERDFKTLQSKSSLAQVIASNTLLDKLAMLRSYVETAKVLDGSADHKGLSDYIEERTQQLKATRTNLQVWIEHDHTTQALASQVEDMLIAENIAVAAGGSRASVAKLILASNVKYFTMLDNHLAKLVVRLQALDAQGEVLAVAEFTESASSDRTPESALDQARLKLAGTLRSGSLLARLAGTDV